MAAVTSSRRRKLIAETLAGALTLTVAGLLSAPVRSVLVAGAVTVGVATLIYLLPRRAASGLSLTAGVLGMGSGVIAHNVLVALGGAAFLAVGLCSGWGVNRGLPRGRRWAARGLTVI